MNMIASDAANPEFMGAHNPDSRLTVQFYTRAEKNNFRSEQEGRPIFDDVDCVKIFVPGDKNNIIDTFVRDDHKQRFPLQWAHFQNKRSGDQRLVGKTPLSEWPRLTPGQAEELRALNFLAVEDIANASDSQLQRIGMIAGTSPYKFREFAQRFLQLAEQDADAVKADKRIAEMETKHEAELQDMKAQMKAMQDQFAAMAAASTAPAAVPLAPETATTDRKKAPK